MASTTKSASIAVPSERSISVRPGVRDAPTALARRCRIAPLATKGARQAPTYAPKIRRSGKLSPRGVTVPGESIGRSAASHASKWPRSSLITVIRDAGTLIRCAGSMLE